MLIHPETPEITIYYLKEKQKTIPFCILSSVGDICISGCVTSEDPAATNIRVIIKVAGSFDILVNFSGYTVSSQKTTFLL